MRYLRLFSDLHLDNDWGLFNGTRTVDARYASWCSDNQKEIGNVTHKEWQTLTYGRPLCEMDELWFPPQLPEDSDTVLVLAGDLWRDNRAVEKLYPEGDSWIGRVSKRFKYVVFVYGNHDYWDTNIEIQPAKTEKLLREQKLDNVYFLEQGIRTCIVLDQVKFVGNTLWTDYKKGDPVVIINARNMVKDYKFITVGKQYNRVNAQDLYRIHKRSKQAIFSQAVRDNPEQLVVVVSHMAPSYKSISDHYKDGGQRNELINPLYYSSLEQEILDAAIDLWVHGHTHVVADYQIGDTRVLCNPRGYTQYESTGYDERFQLDLQEVRTGQANRGSWVYPTE